MYEGLDAKSLTPKNLEWAQNHVCILSGLYGVLRPLDWMQPYRLEMGTPLLNPRGKNLYQFWGASIAQYLNAQLDKYKTPVVINLASQEYFKAVDPKTLKARMIECVFEDYKGGKYKVISFFAKRARGLMARFAIEHKVKTIEQFKAFNSQGYAFAADRIIEIDALNHQVASRVARSFDRWRRFDAGRQQHARAALARLSTDGRHLGVGVACCYDTHGPH